MAVKLYNPSTGEPHTFPSERSAKVYENKGWKRNPPGGKQASSASQSSAGGGQSSS